VEQRGHKVPEKYPFILTSDIENISKTKDLMSALTALGLEHELSRIKEKGMRSGKGKMRGRAHIKKTGPLIVVSKECPLMKIQKSGMDVIPAEDISAEDLAPGTQPARLTLFTESALKTIKEKRLFQ
jgi:large subunit ribosomal protein L4e